MELKEAIKELESLSPSQTAIETVLKALESYKRRYELAIEQNVKDYKNSIPKKRIKNEIEILKAQCGGNPFHIQQTLNAEIRLLQELLEEK